MKRLLLALSLIVSPAVADIPEGTQIVLLGEVHDNAVAHQGQADVIASLAPTAVVFEMLTPEQGALIDRDRTKAPEIWAELPWPEYELYAPIFDALGDAKIIGMAVARETNRQVFTDGPAEIFGEAAAQFGLTQPLPDDQQTLREDMQFSAHCEAMPREMMVGMVHVQRFWDARFAQAALNALNTHGAPVAVILGNGHARTDWGVPAVLAQAAPEVSVYALSFVETDLGAPFDRIETVPAVQRGDPCANLRDG